MTSFAGPVPLVSEQILHTMLHKASESSLKRSHLELHESYLDPIQKVLICLLSTTLIRPHFHTEKHQSEFFVLLKGEVKVILFDEAGLVDDIVCLNDLNFITEIKPNKIHAVVCISENSFLLEVKQGPYVPSQGKEFPPWSNCLESKEMLKRLKVIKRGDLLMQNFSLFER